MTALVALVQPSVQDRYLIAAICTAALIAVLVACAIHGQHRDHNTHNRRER